MRAVAADVEEELDSVSDEGEGPVDQLGIPMSREVRLDDVRSDGVAHRRLAIGCSVAVTVALLAFWLVRVVLLR